MLTSSRYPIARAARSAFTLIELLVVIAIVALLVAILLPGLAEARRAGKQAKNVVNMKGMGTGSQTYGSDNKDYIPHFTRAFGAKVLGTLPNPMSEWGRTARITTTSTLSFLGVDAMDRVLAATGGLSNSDIDARMGGSGNTGWNPLLRYYPLLLVNYLGGKLPDPSFVNPLDRVRSVILSDAAEFLRADNLTRWGFGTDDNNQRVFCFSSSYEPNWGHLQADRGVTNSLNDGLFIEGGSDAGDAERSLDTIIKILRQRRLTEVVSPSDKIFLFDRVSRQSGRTPLPYRHPSALVTDVFWDSSVRVIKSSDSNPGGWVLGPRSRPQVVPATECSWFATPQQGDDAYPDPVAPPAARTGGGDGVEHLLGYHKWTVDGLRGRDVNGKQPPPGRLND